MVGVQCPDRLPRSWGVMGYQWPSVGPSHVCLTSRHVWSPSTEQALQTVMWILRRPKAATA